MSASVLVADRDRPSTIPSVVRQAGTQAECSMGRACRAFAHGSGSGSGGRSGCGSSVVSPFDKGDEEGWGRQSQMLHKSVRSERGRCLLGWMGGCAFSPPPPGAVERQRQKGGDGKERAMNIHSFFLSLLLLLLLLIATRNFLSFPKKRSRRPTDSALSLFVFTMHWRRKSL